MVSGLLMWRAPAMREDVAAAAASPWFASAREALASRHLAEARSALRDGLARDPASALGKMLLRQWSRLSAPPALRRMSVLGLAREVFARDDTALYSVAHARAFGSAAPHLSLASWRGADDAVMCADSPESPVAEARPVAPPRVQTDRATDAYRLLAAGDRRGAAAGFHAALAGNNSDPRAATWSRQLAALEKRWSGDAYVYLRATGAGDPATAAPVLGGGQSGAQIAFSLDPLATRPLALLARASVANSDRDSAQTSLGLSWRPASGVSLAAERLIAIGPASRSAWNLRAAGGTASASASRLDWSIYGEGGVIGARRRDLYAAALGHAGIVRRFGPFTGGPAFGGWASVQRTDRTVGRVNSARRYGCEPQKPPSNCRSTTGSASPATPNPAPVLP